MKITQSVTIFFLFFFVTLNLFQGLAYARPFYIWGSGDTLDLDSLTGIKYQHRGTTLFQIDTTGNTTVNIFITNSLWTQLLKVYGPTDTTKIRPTAVESDTADFTVQKNVSTVLRSWNWNDSTVTRLGGLIARSTIDSTVIDSGRILQMGKYNFGWTVPNLSPGSRFLWYPKKAALRAGYITSGYGAWDDGNIGNFSVDFGFDCIAKAEYSAVVNGYDNTNYSDAGFIGSGYNNNILSTDFANVINGGMNNLVGATAYRCNVIGGGLKNYIDSSYSSAICGGGGKDLNQPDSNKIIRNWASTIVGGYGNTIRGRSNIGDGYPDRGNIVGGVRSIVDSCSGSFAMNCQVQKADSTFGFSKRIWIMFSTDTTILTPTSIQSDTAIILYWKCLTTSAVIDSFKLNAVADTLFFFIAGSKFAAKKP